MADLSKPYTLASELASTIDACLSLGVSQRESLRKRAAPIGAAIVKEFETDAVNAGCLATAVFLRVRGEYLKAKTQGAKSRATGLGEAWNRTRSAITAALDSAKLRADWPALPSGLTKAGSAVATVMTAAQAKEAAEALSDAKESADAAALASHQADEAQRELAELRALGPVDMALKLQSLLDAWGGDQSAVFGALGLTVSTGMVKRDPHNDMAKAA